MPCESIGAGGRKRYKPSSRQPRSGATHRSPFGITPVRKKGVTTSTIATLAFTRSIVSRQVRLRCLVLSRLREIRRNGSLCLGDTARSVSAFAFDGAQRIQKEYLQTDRLYLVVTMAEQSGKTYSLVFQKERRANQPVQTTAMTPPTAPTTSSAPSAPTRTCAKPACAWPAAKAPRPRNAPSSPPRGNSP